MPGIPTSILRSLRKTLLKCEPFGSNQTLRNLFIDDRIVIWQERLPDAITRNERVETLINFLHDKKNKTGSNGLILFLKALIEQIDPEDDLHNQLLTRIDELSLVFGEKDNPTVQLAHSPAEIQPHANKTEASYETDPNTAVRQELHQPKTEDQIISDKRDFFISYNRHDKQIAEWIAWQLEEAGYTTIIQAWDFRPGGNFVADMQIAAASVERTIAVLSPDYLASSFTQPEWNAAFAQDPTGVKGILVPVRVRECEPKGLLPQIVYIDLVGLSEDEAKRNLLSGVKRERAKPLMAPEYKNKTP